MRVLTIAHQHPERDSFAPDRSAYAVFRHLKDTIEAPGLFVAASYGHSIDGSRSVMAFQGRSDELLIKAPEVDPVSLVSTDTGRTHAIVSKLCDLFRPDMVHLQDIASVGLSTISHLKAKKIPVALTVRDVGAMPDDEDRSLDAIFPMSGSERRGEAPAADRPIVSRAAHHVRTKLLRRYLADVTAFAVPSSFLAQRLARLVDGSEIQIIPDPAYVRAGLKHRRPALPGRVHIAVFVEDGADCAIEIALRSVEALDQDTRSKLRVDVFRGEGAILPHREPDLGEILEGLRPVVRDLGNARHGRLHDSLVDYDWLLLPSSRRATTLALVQDSLLVGTPVIGPDSGELADFVLEGQTGTVFTDGSAASLSRLLAAILLGVIEPPVVDREDMHRSRELALSSYVEFLSRVRGTKRH